MNKFEEEVKEAYEKVSRNLYGNNAGSIGMKKLLNELKDTGLLKDQQALPVVPEYVAVQIERIKNSNGNFATLGLFDWNHETKPDYTKWIHENVFDFMRACTIGYTVEKPQLFYLKHIDFCKTDKHYDWLTIKHSDGPLNHLRVEKGQKPSTIDCKFTQQEIDSMETGSYEQIKVEDGE